MDRTIQPNIKDAVDFSLQLKSHTLFTLDNGVQVYSVNAGTQEVFQLELVFFAGNCFEIKNGVAYATNHLLKNGTVNKTAFEINEHFDYYGAHCSRSCHNETALISLHALTKHLPVLLPVIKEMISESIFPDSEMDIFVQNTKQKLSVKLKKCDFVANRLIDQYVYGDNHPYGKYLVEKDLDEMQVSDIKDFYNRYYVNGTCVLFISGNLPADIFQQLNATFGKLSLKPKTGKLPTSNIISATQKKYKILNEENAVQGAIRIARSFPNRHHPDFKPMMVLNTLFGGYFGSRLMSNIREDKGYTYGISSYVQNNLQQTALMISTEAGIDVCEATVAEVFKEMKVLREELVDEDELMMVRNYLLGSILGDLDGPFQIMSRWKNIVLNDLSESYFYESIDVIKTITAKEIMELANKYYIDDEFYELIVT